MISGCAAGQSLKSIQPFVRGVLYSIAKYSRADGVELESVYCNIELKIETYLIAIQHACPSIGPSCEGGRQRQEDDREDNW